MAQNKNNLRYYRLRKGLTQMQVARAIGLASSDRVSLWESGYLYPHVKNFVKLIKLYEIRAEDVYKEELKNESSIEIDSMIIDT